jgi:hypothetical protein
VPYRQATTMEAIGMVLVVTTRLEIPASHFPERGYLT